MEDVIDSEQKLNEYMNSFLGSYNFSKAKTRNEYETSRWIKSTSWNAEVHIYVALSPVIDNRKGVKYSVDIGLMSSLFTEVENGAELWRCGMGLLDPQDLPWKFPLTIVSASLNWIIKSRGEEVVGAWFLNSRDGSSTEQRRFSESFDKFAVPFFLKLDELDSVVDMLTHLAELNNLVRVQGLTSFDEVNGLAVCLFYSVRKQQAFEFLDSLLNGAQFPLSMRQAFEKNRDYEAVVKCRIRAVRDYLEKKDKKRNQGEAGCPPM